MYKIRPQVYHKHMMYTNKFVNHRELARTNHLNVLQCTAQLERKYLHIYRSFGAFSPHVCAGICWVLWFPGSF